MILRPACNQQECAVKKKRLADVPIECCCYPSKNVLGQDSCQELAQACPEPAQNLPRTFPGLAQDAKIMPANDLAKILPKILPKMIEDMMAIFLANML